MAASFRAWSICRVIAGTRRCASVSRVTLKDALHGERLDSAILVGESPLARLHLMIRPKPGDQPAYDIAALEAEINQIVRNWHDELREILVQKHGEEKGSKLAARYGKSLPAGYIEEVTPQIAANDVELAASLARSTIFASASIARVRHPDKLHFKVFRLGGDIAVVRSHSAA